MNNPSEIVPVATRLIGEIYSKTYNLYYLHPFVTDVSDVELLKHLIMNSNYTAASLAAFAATVIPTCIFDVLALAAFGRIDAAEVASEYNRGSKNATCVGYQFTANPIAANILGLVFDSDGRIRVDQVNTELNDSMTRERATHLQALYRAQRAARAGGQPVDPALVAAAYPQVQVGPEHARDFISELQAWVDGKFAASNAAHHASMAALVTLAAVYADECNTAADSSRAAADALSAYKNLASAAAAASADAQSAYKNAAEAAAAAAATITAAKAAKAAKTAKAAAAAVPVLAATPAAAVPVPAATPAVDIRGAVADLTKAVAALTKLLADRAAPAAPAASV